MPKGTGRLSSLCPMRQSDRRLAMSSSNQSFSDNGGAGKLLRKILLGKDLPIEPLQQQEWDFSKCTTWERARCWDYEIQRESKRARENTRQWREDFPKWVEQRIRDDQEDDALHLGLTRQDCEEMRSEEQTSELQS